MPASLELNNSVAPDVHHIHRPLPLRPDILTDADKDSTRIAPWDDPPPTPPPQPPPKQRPFGFTHKSSFSTFRNGSASSTVLRPWIDYHSSHSSTEGRGPSFEEVDPPRSRVGSESTVNSTERPRGSKSGGLFSRLRSSKSKVSLRADSIDGEHPSLRPPPPLPDLYASFLQIPGPHVALAAITPAPSLLKRGRDKKKKSSIPESNYPLQHYNDDPSIIMLDTNIDLMDGIIDLSRITSDSFTHIPSTHSPESTSFISDSSSSFTMITPFEFRDPFSPGRDCPKRGATEKEREVRKVGPKDRPSPHSAGGGGNPLLWIAPESWAVETGRDAPEPDDSSSDESAPPENETGGEHRMKFAPNANIQIDTVPEHLLPTLLLGPQPAHHNNPKRRKTRGKTAGGGGGRGSGGGVSGKGKEKALNIRIYRPTNAFHIVTLPPQVTVASLTPHLNEKLLEGKDTEQHRLYLKERGRERILAQTERPANIVRRRMEQAGYDPADGLELLGGISLEFLLKFVYKSQYLGSTHADEEITFETFDNIDLTGRGLHTIPVVLHQHADSIVALRLSGNPMLEIPLDFIQSCTTLRDLRLSNMAMKKVPQSVRHSASLSRLDLSCNRISDLEEAFLDEIAALRALYLQNNRIERLPWCFPRLGYLVTLNVSNNKFRQFPAVITQLGGLRDLDISFNLIAELPEALGKLVGLERLVIVGNQVARFPEECVGLVGLRVLDCRRNLISDLGVVGGLPKLQELRAEHNAVQGLNLAGLGDGLTELNASHNEITHLSLGAGAGAGEVAMAMAMVVTPRALTSLDISHAKLSSLDGLAFTHLSALRTLRLDHNSFRALPETLGDLTCLETLSCSDNKLDAIPASIGRLQELKMLDAHNNCLTELPASLWNCASLVAINATSNFLGVWHDPPPVVVGTGQGQGQGQVQGGEGEGEGGVEVVGGPPSVLLGAVIGRKTSTTSLLSVVGPLPPLANSLKKLYLGENRLTDEVLHWLMVLREIRVLNLSFNELQDLPMGFLKNFGNLEELYLSGNKLTSIPSEDLHRLTNLAVLYLNGNKLHTLPQELGKVKSLQVLDVGSNLLKYNVNNWEFDWNWNFNKNLQYLNLSGNNRLQIKTDPTKRLGRRSYSISSTVGRQSLSGFTDLTSLRVLGLMDVTITTTGSNATVDIPDENEDRRVRTSSSTVLGMPYGIADSIGKNDSLNMLDLVHEFRDRKDEAIFAMFGRCKPPDSLAPGASPNRLAKFLHDRFIPVMLQQLTALKPLETVPDALRRTFLKLNQDLHDALYTHPRKMSTASNASRGILGADPATLSSGTAGVVVYFVGKMMYVANVGNALAVVSRQGEARPVSRKHDPFVQSEIMRIRAAEGWVSPPGLVNGLVDMSRAFGFFHLLPVINARPDVFTYEVSPQDEFVIVANRGLWDYISYQTAVDIARSERADPMIAAQKLRDFAISYGAEGTTMIMVIGVNEPEIGIPKKIKNPILDRQISRLDGEVPAPVGHIALVFSDIRNSTHLWEANPGMATAHRIHNNLLRRQLRFCGGYEVKTEGDAFMCSFPTSLAAVWWCLSVQQQLIQADWPLEILECEDGKPINDSQGRVIAKGLSVRMGIHCGTPVPEPDPITGRMDYFGSMVNRSARICGNAAGGQIMCSAEIIREVNASIFNKEPETDHSKQQPLQAIEAIRCMEIAIIPVGEVKLKGLEVPEYLSCLYLAEHAERHEWGSTGPTASGSRVPFSIPQMHDLGLICLRLETLTTSRIFRPFPERKASIQTTVSMDEAELPPPTTTPTLLYGDPKSLLPPMNAQSTDAELMALLDSLSVRIVNAAAKLAEMYSSHLQATDPSFDKETVLSTLTERGGLDERTLEYVLTLLNSI